MDRVGILLTVLWVGALQIMLDKGKDLDWFGSGFILALALVLAVSWIFVKSTPFAVDRTFRVLQFVSASFYSLGHGGNDAQKTMGIIAVLLFSQGYLGSEFSVPFWVVLSCQAAMALGTLMGGWRIVRTTRDWRRRSGLRSGTAPAGPASSSPSRRNFRFTVGATPAESADASAE